MKFYNISDKRREACQTAMLITGFNVEFLWSRVTNDNGNMRATVNCKNCGFHTNRSLSDLQKGKFFCYGCHHKDLEAVSDKYNFNLSSFDSKYCHLQCRSCNSYKKVGKSALYNSGLSCQYCLEDKYQSISEDFGFTLLKRSNGGQLFHLLCRTCETSRTANMSSVLAGEAKCI